MTTTKETRPNQAAVPGGIATATLEQFKQPAPAEKAEDERVAKIFGDRGPALFRGLTNVLSAVQHGMLVAAGDLTPSQKSEMERELAFAAHDLKEAREALGWERVGPSMHCEREAS